MIVTNRKWHVAVISGNRQEIFLFDSKDEANECAIIEKAFSSMDDDSGESFRCTVSMVIEFDL